MQDTSRVPLLAGAFDIDEELAEVSSPEPVERVVMRMVGAGRGRGRGLREEEQIPLQMPDVLLDPVPD